MARSARAAKASQKKKPAKKVPVASLNGREPAGVAAWIRVTPPGPKAKGVIARDTEYLSHSYTRAYPLVIERGQGVNVWDADGNRYLDFTSGVAVNALGHSHPAVVRAIQEQSQRFVHMAGTDFYYDVMVRYAQRLSESVPGKDPKHCFLTNSGTEAIEAGIKLARWSTRRPKFIAFFNAFHGRTIGALSLTSSKAIQRRGFSPLLDVSHAPYGDLDFLKKNLFDKTAPPEDVAAIFVEPIQGEGGYRVAPAGFLSGLRELCTKYGILLVVDEVQTGLGRTGKMWAVEHFGVVPDILCTAKPIGGGLPLGAMIARADLMKWPSGAHANTFGGNPIACAAGLAVLEAIDANLLRKVTRMGELIHKHLQSLVVKYPLLREPRGLGLMRAVSVVREDGSPDHDRRDRLVEACFERGLLLLGCGEDGIRFIPPLNVEAEAIDAAFDVFERAAKAI